LVLSSGVRLLFRCFIERVSEGDVNAYTSTASGKSGRATPTSSYIEDDSEEEAKRYEDRFALQDTYTLGKAE